jgi:DNA modification methylase
VKEQYEFKIKKLSDLSGYDSNSRTHSEEQIQQIAKSIKTFGFTNPILIDENNGIIAGHGRALAAAILNIDNVHDKAALVIADNKLAENAGWNYDALKSELGFLNDVDFDLSLTGFSDDELSDLLDLNIDEGLTDEDSVPEVPETPKSKLGDVWLLGNHRLMCGDSTSEVDVEKLMNGEKANCVITDPPYNQETHGGFKGEIGASLKKQSADIEHLCNFEPEEFLSVLPMTHNKGKLNATIFCNKDLVPRYLNWAVENKYSFNILIWKKPSAIPLGGSYMPDIEYMLVFRKSATFNTKILGVRYSKVLECKRETGLHPTMKPIELIENQLQIVSNKNDIVVDFFGGSGSTMIACEKHGRTCLMNELDEKYVDVIINRWQDYTGKKATREDGQLFDDIAI